jgi:hypothetical protein
MMLKGRHWLALWLGFVLVALSLVVWRQTDAIRTARVLTQTRAERTELESKRAEFVRRIRAAESRGSLIPRAQGRLGLRQAADSEIIFLPMPPADSNAAPGGGPR